MKRHPVPAVSGVRWPLEVTWEKAFAGWICWWKWSSFLQRPCGHPAKRGSQLGGLLWKPAALKTKGKGKIKIAETQANLRGYKRE